MSTIEHYKLMQDFHHNHWESEREYILNKYNNKDSLTQKDAQEIINKYHLSKVQREIPWNYVQIAILPNELVLMQFYLRTYNKDIICYILEKNGKKFCKLFDLRKLTDFAKKISKEIFNNTISCCEEINIGMQCPEYRIFSLNECENIEIDNEFDNIITEIGKINSKPTYMNDFDCQYSVTYVTFSCYDFINKNVFNADGFCLTEFKPYVDLLMYIMKKFEKDEDLTTIIHLVDNLDDAQIIAVKKFIDSQYFHYFTLR